MGWIGAPFYGEDLGSSVEKIEKCIAKLKTNKFDNEDLVDFRNAMAVSMEVVEKYINENKE